MRLTEKGTTKVARGSYQLKSGDNVIYEHKEDLERLAKNGQKNICDKGNK